VKTRQLTPSVTPLHRPARLAALICVTLLGGLLITTLALIEMTSGGHPDLGMIVLVGYRLLLCGGCAYWVGRGHSTKTPR
jgi:hypothetical protein